MENSSITQDWETVETSSAPKARTTNAQNDVSKLKLIKNLSLASLIAIIVLTIIGISLYIAATDWTKFVNNRVGLISAYQAMLALSGVIGGGLSLAASIMILIQNWKNQKANDQKILFGILSIFCGPLVSLIYSIQMLKNYK